MENQRFCRKKRGLVNHRPNKKFGPSEKQQRPLEWRLVRSTPPISGVGSVTGQLELSPVGHFLRGRKTLGRGVKLAMCEHRCRFGVLD